MSCIIIPSQSDYISPLLSSIQDEKTPVLNASQVCQLPHPLHIANSGSIYISSDTLFATIAHKLPDKIRAQIAIMRDKYQFRKRVATLHPDFFFKKIQLQQLSSLSLSFANNQEYIIKPCTGFMALGSHIITENTSIADLSEKLHRDIAHFNKFYPGIYQDQWLIESKIESDTEVAVDMYYDHSGQPIIVNVYHHPKAKHAHYPQMLYYTSTSLVNEYHQKFLDYFKNFNADKLIRNFPIHAEFFVLESGDLVPIEFNAARFGGMGLADLCQYAYGYNPYAVYFKRDTINWKYLAKHNKEYYVWLLAYNETNLDGSRVPDRAKLANYLTQFADIIEHNPLDHHKLPAFSIFYLRLHNKNIIDRLLEINFADFHVVREK